MKTLSRRVRALIFVALIGAVLAAVAAPAFGHATVQTYGSTPKADGYGAFWIRIGHGCEDKKGNPVAVNKVTVWLQGAFQSGKPQQLDGWKASVTPFKGKGGYKVTWVATGDDLQDSEFQDFGISTKYPATPGSFRVPVTQYCGAYKTAWVERGSEAAHPAPTITIAAAAASSH